MRKFSAGKWLAVQILPKWGFVFIVVALSLLVAQRVRAELLTLERAVQIGLEKSPEAQQAQEQWESARAKERLAYSPSEPNLVLTYNDLTTRFNTASSASHSVVLNQTLGFPGRAFLAASQLNELAESQRFNLEATRLQLATTVKTAYWNLQLARRNLRLNGDTQLAFERILEIAKRRYEAGATGQVDYLNAQVGLLSNQNDLTDLKAAEKAALATLNVALHEAVDNPIEVTPIQMTYFKIPPFQDALEKMLKNRRELQAALAQSRASEKSYKLAWMQLLPDFQFSIGVNNYDLPAASPYSSLNDYPTQTYSFGVGVTIPLWGLFNEREVIRGAARDRGASARAVDILLNQSKVQLQTLLENLHSAEEKVRNFEQHILPLAEQSLRLALTDYSSGKADFPTLAATAASRRQAYQTYLQTVVNYLTTYSSYGQLIGEDL